MGSLPRAGLPGIATGMLTQRVQKWHTGKPDYDGIRSVIVRSGVYFRAAVLSSIYYVYPKLLSLLYTNLPPTILE